MLVKNIKEELVRELQGLVAQAEEKGKHFHNAVEKISEITVRKGRHYANAPINVVPHPPPDGGRQGEYREK